MVDHSTTSAFISGGTQGLGMAVAEQLIRQGCRKLTITGRNMKRGEDAAQRLRDLGADCLFAACDAGKVEDCQSAMAAAIAHHGTVNALVNSAADTSRGSLVDTTPDMFDAHMATNIRGPFFLMQGMVRHLLDSGAPGSIVNILSTSAHVGQSCLAAYATSKGGLITLTKNTANAYRSNLIRCNGVAPGWMDTPGEDVVQKRFHDAPDDWLETAEAGLPMRQLVKPDQIAPLITYLLSPDSGIITGAIIDYDQQIIGAVPE
jgi:NAD(P)-dependent dehydrogenase (short-subunit alcohol dehydrogenase family)